MAADTTILVRALTLDDRAWVRNELVREWTSTAVARRGELVDAADLRGHVALLGGRRVGSALAAVRDDGYEVVAISTTRRRHGVGRALMERCFDEARAGGCHRVWLVTTDDNVGAIAFYEALGLEKRREVPIRDEATNIFMGVPGEDLPELELTHNYGVDGYELGTAYGHVALTVDDLDVTLEHLKEMGIEPEKPPYRIREGGSRLCFVRDPDDYRVELIERSG